MVACRSFCLDSFQKEPRSCVAVHGKEMLTLALPDFECSAAVMGVMKTGGFELRCHTAEPVGCVTRRTRPARRGACATSW